MTVTTSSRRRWGVVLLFDAQTAAEVQGLRRAVGSPMLDRVPPHITLVPPVNLRAHDVATAMDVLRDVGARHGPLTLCIGPVATFAPVTPVLYLGVRGEGVGSLAGCAQSGPLARPQQFPYVPHVTLHEEASDSLIASGRDALRAYQRDVEIDRLWVLQQDHDRVWRPLADVELGPALRSGRGGIALAVRRSSAVAPDAAALVGIHQRADGRVVHEALVDGVLAGAAVSRLPPGTDVTLIEAVSVDPAWQGQGVGRRLVVAVADEARTAGSRRLEWRPQAADAAIDRRAYGLAASLGFTEDGTGGWSRPT